MCTTGDRFHFSCFVQFDRSLGIRGQKESSGHFRCPLTTVGLRLNHTPSTTGFGKVPRLFVLNPVEGILARSALVSPALFQQHFPTRISLDCEEAFAQSNETENGVAHLQVVYPVSYG